MPDGVGLRNFVYSGFFEKGQKQGFDIVYWNNTLFSIGALGYPEIKMEDARMHPMNYIYKNARKEIELNFNKKKSGDGVYDTYRFPYPYNTFKNVVKSLATKWVVATHNSQRGLDRIIGRIDALERKTDSYRRNLNLLEREKPAMLFLTNQRQVNAISAILAAKDLGIPTATFIFSWDNLPKATMVVDTDYYIVWSELMKAQLLYYYPRIRPEQVFITGTPQFESHFDAALIEPRASFFARHGMDSAKRYICFSGDDYTSSPDDPDYLEDAALAVRALNQKGHNLGIAFRRCPPDVSNRYDEVLAKYADVITELAPLWKNLGETWTGVLPMPEDLAMQANTIAHTEFVVNLGSSMVFDYVAFKKPCGYFNYNQPIRREPNWDLRKCYNYVHFRSMPSKDVVVWLDDKASLAGKFEEMLAGVPKNVAAAQQWFEIVNQRPADAASERIWQAFEKILAAKQQNP